MKNLIDLDSTEVGSVRSFEADITAVGGSTQMGFHHCRDCRDCCVVTHASNRSYSKLGISGIFCAGSVFGFLVGPLILGTSLRFLQHLLDSLYEKKSDALPSDDDL